MVNRNCAFRTNNVTFVKLIRCGTNVIQHVQKHVKNTVRMVVIQEAILMGNMVGMTAMIHMGRMGHILTHVYNRVSNVVDVPTAL